ncbi:MAG: nucleotide exchange factor GrpE [Candidatus Woesearchaeota archaeon]
MQKQEQNFKQNQKAEEQRISLKTDLDESENRNHLQDNAKNKSMEIGKENKDNKDNKDNRDNNETKDKDVSDAERNLESLKKLVEEKDKEIEELINHLKRLQAEFENYKKRVEKDKEQANNIVLKDFIKNLLPVLDSFEIALKNSADLKNFKSGVELIYAQLYNLLKNYGVSEIKSLGEKFNPLMHEVLMAEESNVEKDTIIEEFQKGYLLNGFVLRTAKVKISSGEDAKNLEGKNEKAEEQTAKGTAEGKNKKEDLKKC